MLFAPRLRATLAGLLFALPAAAQQPATGLSLPEWLRGASQPTSPKIFTPTEDEAEMCPLRPSRVSILKLGIAPTRTWRHSFVASVPIVFGFERRITPDLSFTAGFGAASAPWNREGATRPKLRAFDVTVGARVYLNSLFTDERRPEFSGFYAALERQFLFIGEQGQAGGPFSYRYQRGSQLVVGQQVRIGEHGLIDMNAGLRRTVVPGQRATFAPTAGLTFGLIY